MYGQLISSVTVGAGGAASIDFTSIPGTYTDIVLVLSARATGTDGTLLVQFNGSSTGYSYRWLYADGSTVGSNSGSTGYFGRVGRNSETSNTFGNLLLTIPNYSGSTNKTVTTDAVTENNATSALQTLSAGLWANTSAITSISLTIPFGTSFAQYSTASLYGLTKGSGGATVS